mmetsp:Transcript_25598/g.52090  ORF Transcript_25598/g.52090 Transcript_25598/m.52090 type:complete len:235 (+) Transcript_25598:232-936(+)
MASESTTYSSQSMPARNHTPSPFPRATSFFGCIFLKQGVMCICYAQMMSATLMFVLITLLVMAFIDEEQFLKAHYVTASKRLFMASMMYGAPALVLIGAFYGAEFAFAVRCLSSIAKSEPDGIRYYYLYQVWALSFSLAAFCMTTRWTLNDMGNMVFDIGLWGYFIWCIWSLHEALMIGGETALLAGFGQSSALERSSLLGSPAEGQQQRVDTARVPASSYLPGRDASHFIERL